MGKYTNDDSFKACKARNKRFYRKISTMMCVTTATIVCSTLVYGYLALLVIGFGIKVGSKGIWLSDCVEEFALASPASANKSRADRGGLDVLLTLLLVLFCIFLMILL